MKKILLLLTLTVCFSAFCHETNLSSYKGFGKCPVVSDYPSIVKGLAQYHNLSIKIDIKQENQVIFEAYGQRGEIEAFDNDLSEVLKTN